MIRALLLFCFLSMPLFGSERGFSSKESHISMVYPQEGQSTPYVALEDGSLWGLTSNQDKVKRMQPGDKVVINSSTRKAVLSHESSRLQFAAENAGERNKEPLLFTRRAWSYGDFGALICEKRAFESLGETKGYEQLDPLSDDWELESFLTLYLADNGKGVLLHEERAELAPVQEIEHVRWARSDRMWLLDFEMENGETWVVFPGKYPQVEEWPIGEQLLAFPLYRDSKSALKKAWNREALFEEVGNPDWETYEQKEVLLVTPMRREHPPVEFWRQL